MKYRIEIEKFPACAIARCGRTVDAIEDFEVDKENSRLSSRVVRKEAGGCRCNRSMSDFRS
jgi:hypothetical protein